MTEEILKQIREKLRDNAGSVVPVKEEAEESGSEE